MIHNLDELKKKAIDAIHEINDVQGLEDLRIGFLGKKGCLTEVLKSIPSLDVSERPLMGQKVNAVKQIIHALIDEKMNAIKMRDLEKKLASERIDVTLPGRHAKMGSMHPVTEVKQFIHHYFMRLGFDSVLGPEAETTFYNFEALNIPPHHPARAAHDTFYLDTGHLLRTHTSPVQIRAMEGHKPPFRLIAPGRVYRCDSDMTHTPMFHQVEGLVVDGNVTMAQLKGLLQDFFTHFFGKERALRFRPSYFPFTEPSAEVDIECTQCLGKGCRMCKYTGFLEVGGCGMVHPHVLSNVNISPEKYQGFAFGMGIDRLAMLYFGLDDLRTFFESDVAFLQQFSGYQIASYHADHAESAGVNE